MRMTKARYLQILYSNLDANPELWLKAEDELTVEEVKQVEREGNLMYSGEAAMRLLEQGETFWSCPGWVADIAREFEYPDFSNLLRLRLLAQQLLTTAPDDCLDDELVGKLRYLAEGQFCVVYEGYVCNTNQNA